MDPNMQQPPNRMEKVAIISKFVHQLDSEIDILEDELAKYRMIADALAKRVSDKILAEVSAELGIPLTMPSTAPIPPVADDSKVDDSKVEAEKPNEEDKK